MTESIGRRAMLQAGLGATAGYAQYHGSEGRRTAASHRLSCGITERWRAL
jgi:hypothetical protein